MDERLNTSYYSLLKKHPTDSLTRKFDTILKMFLKISTAWRCLISVSLLLYWYKFNFNFNTRRTKTRATFFVPGALLFD